MDVTSIREQAVKSSFEFVTEDGRFVRSIRPTVDRWLISQRDTFGDMVRGCFLMAGIDDDHARTWSVVTYANDTFVEVDSRHGLEAALGSAVDYVLEV